MSEKWDENGVNRNILTALLKRDISLLYYVSVFNFVLTSPVFDTERLQCNLIDIRTVSKKFNINEVPERPQFGVP